MSSDPAAGTAGLSPAQVARTRRSREALVDGGLLAAPPGVAGVPALIEKSWRRCVGDEVPVAPDAIAYREPDDVFPALRRAAEPVLDRLRHSFAEVPVAMVLSDATGRIVMRHVEVRRQRTAMDRAHAAVGFDFSEQSVGTNGLGTVLVERRAVLVRGPEHYNPCLENLTCAGTPVVEPFTGRVLGSFSLACITRDVHPLMSVFTGDIGRQIEERLLDEAGERRRRLVRAYLAVDGASTAALVVDEDTVLANRPGLDHAGPELHAVLWRFLSEHAREGTCRMAVPLADGTFDALVEPIREAGRQAFSVRLLPADRREPPAAARPVARRRRLHHVPGVDRRLEQAARFGETVALTGASGTGKVHTARRVLARRGAPDPLVVDAAGPLGAARAALLCGRGVVLRRVHEVVRVAPVRALLESGGPLALTLDLDGIGVGAAVGAPDGAVADAVLALVRRYATTVRLPTLAQSRDHLPGLVQAILAGLPEPESRTRLSSRSWERLLAWHWPGNVAELHTTVVALARRARGGLVEEADLPDELRAPRRGMRLMATAERDAVAAALRAADGNRSRAAQALGIGRNTLYRKMREFGLE